MPEILTTQEELLCWVDERREITARVKGLRAAAGTIRIRLQRGWLVEPGPISCEIEIIQVHGTEVRRLLVDGRALDDF